MAGTHPAEWGQDGSLQKLTLLDTSRGGMTGPLPASWGAQFTELESFGSANNDLTGGRCYLQGTRVHLAEASWLWLSSCLHALPVMQSSNLPCLATEPCSPCSASCHAMMPHICFWFLSVMASVCQRIGHAPCDDTLQLRRQCV